MKWYNPWRLINWEKCRQAHSTSQNLTTGEKGQYNFEFRVRSNVWRDRATTWQIQVALLHAWRCSIKLRVYELVPTSEKTHSTSIRNTNILMLFAEIFCLQESHEHTNTMSSRTCCVVRFHGAHTLGYEQLHYDNTTKHKEQAHYITYVCRLCIWGYSGTLCQLQILRNVEWSIKMWTA